MSRFTCPVYFCPDGETAEHAIASTKVHLTLEDTFEELLIDIARYFGVDISKVHLRDANGAIWPLRHQVSLEVRDESVVRLVNIEADD